MDGCGWRRLGFGDGDPIPILDFAVPTALAGTLALSGPAMVGAAIAVAADLASVRVSVQCLLDEDRIRH
jgi:hypothetical protein